MKRREGSFLAAGTAARFIFAAVMTVGYLIMLTYLKLNPELAGRLTDVTRAMGMIMSGAASYVKYTIAEILFYVLLMCLAIYLVIIVYKMITSKHIGARLLRLLSNILAAVSLFLVLSFMVYGVNYLAPSKAEIMGVEQQTADARTLEVVTKYMLNKVNEYAPTMPRDINGNCEFGDLNTKSSLVIDAYENLAYKYNFISGTFAPVKVNSNKKLMKTIGISGIYVPFTGEAIVDDTQPEPYMIFSMAKAVANRLSLASMDEADYAAFAVCRESSDRRVAYSAYFMAYRSCITALSELDNERAAAIKAEMNESMSVDMIQYKEYNQQSDGRLAKLCRSLNNAYLKLLGEDSADESSRHFVEYLISEYGKIL